MTGNLFWAIQLRVHVSGRSFWADWEPYIDPEVAESPYWEPYALARFLTEEEASAYLDGLRDAAWREEYDDWVTRHAAWRERAAVWEQRRDVLMAAGLWRLDGEEAVPLPRPVEPSAPPPRDQFAALWRVVEDTDHVPRQHDAFVQDVDGWTVKVHLPVTPVSDVEALELFATEWHFAGAHVVVGELPFPSRARERYAL